MSTEISWCHYTAPNGKIVRGFTFNPAKGCSHAGYQPAEGPKQAHPGCQKCYAERWVKGPYPGCAKATQAWDGTIEIFPDRLAWPFERWKARRDGLPRIGFTHSESDPGHPNYPIEFWMAVQGVMLLSPWVIWKDLTKRPEVMRERLERYSPADCVGIAEGTQIPWWFKEKQHAWKWEHATHIHRYVSVSDQGTADALIPELLRMPAAVRGVSAEPMLGEIDLTWHFAAHPRCLPGCGWHFADGRRRYYHVGGQCRPAIDHVIIGGESGPKARPFDLAWPRDVIEQCRAAGVAAYLKQMGGKPFCHRSEEWYVGAGVFRTAEIRDAMLWPRYDSRKGSDPAEWPEDLRVREHVGLPEGCR